jgi:hypothetical protein
MKKNLLIFGTKNFNNSFEEIKEDLDFSLTFFQTNQSSHFIDPSSSIIIVDSQVCEDNHYVSIINSIFNKPILLLKSKNSISKCKFDDEIYLPIGLTELKNKITNFITRRKFNKNSSIIIKNFILDKNERKLKKNNLFIRISEREVQLIELLFNEEHPLSKNIILKKIWKYADDAHTHTVETHIYRLRKKILHKFKEDNFIINSKLGYTI